MRKELFSLHVLFIYFSSQGNSQLYLLSIVPKYPRVYQEITIIINNSLLSHDLNWVQKTKAEEGHFVL